MVEKSVAKDLEPLSLHKYYPETAVRELSRVCLSVAGTYFREFKFLGSSRPVPTTLH
jgi:hypothetical protein